MTSVTLPSEAVRAQISSIEKEIRVQQRVLEQASKEKAWASTFEIAIADLAFSLERLKKQALKIKDPSLEEDIESLSADLNCLKTRVSILIQQNKLVVSASNAILNLGAMPRPLEHTEGFLELRDTLRFTCVNKTRHSLKQTILQNKLRDARHLSVYDVIDYAIALGHPDDLEGVLKFCKKLVSFDCTPENSREVRVQTLKALASTLPDSITTLRLSKNKITDALLLSFANRLPKLQFVDLGACREISTAGMNYLGLTCQEIFGLDIQGCHLGSSSWLSSFPNLREIDCGQSGLQISDLAASCNSLTHLNATVSSFSDGQGWRAIAANCQQLQRMEISIDYSHEGCTEVIERCPQLRHLSLVAVNALTLDQILNLVKSGPKMTSFTFKQARWVGTFPIWSELPSKCHLLSKQDLAMITWDPYDGITQNGLHQVRSTSLKLVQADRMTDADIGDLVNKDKQITELALSCKSRNDKITDKSLSELTNCREHLKRLRLPECDVTIAGLRQLLKECTKLEYLELRKGQISEEDFARLQQEYPRVKIAYKPEEQ